DSQEAQQPWRAGKRHAQAGSETARHGLELVANPPGSRTAVRIHVREHPEDAAAARRRRGEAVDMQPGIVFAPRRRPSRDFGRTKTGTPALDARTIRGTQIANERQRCVAEPP